jgi:hypothetical protein
MTTDPAASSWNGVHVFSAPADAPRVRRSSDAATSVALAALIVFLAIVVGDGTAFDGAWGEMVARLPGWVRWVSQAAYVVGVAYAATLLVAVALFATGRLELVRDLLLSATLACLTAASAATRNCGARTGNSE